MLYKALYLIIYFKCNQKLFILYIVFYQDSVSLFVRWVIFYRERFISYSTEEWDFQEGVGISSASWSLIARPIYDR